MTINYAIKRCKNFGFTQNIETAISLLGKESIILSQNISEWKNQLNSDKSHKIIVVLGSTADSTNSHVKPFDDLSRSGRIGGFADDIKFVVKENEKGEKSSSKYSRAKEDLRETAISGNSSQLEAFSKGVFSVIRGRRTSNIESYSYLQNHYVIDSLVQNGVVGSPDNYKSLSLYILMKHLSTLKEFEIVFVHPSLLVVKIFEDSPSEQAKPEYEIGSGEILAVIYRYICLHFFGYCSVLTETLNEWNYLF
jgi:hypothetical protein